MNLIKEITSGPGFAIVKISDFKKFEYLRDTFINKMNLDGKKDILVLRKKIGSNEKSRDKLNKAMVSLLSFNEASEIMIEI